MKKGNGGNAFSTTAIFATSNLNETLPTPAMESGVTDRLWEIEDIIKLLD